MRLLLSRRWSSAASRNNVVPSSFQLSLPALESPFVASVELNLVVQSLNNTTFSVMRLLF